MCSKHAAFVCEFAVGFLFAYLFPDNLLLIVGFNQVQVIARSAYTVEVDRVGRVDYLALRKVYFPSTVRHIVRQGE